MLSIPIARQSLHTRTLAFRGYEREDGLWDMEGELHDTKHYDYQGGDGPVAAGTPIHHLHLRVTLDDQLRIQAIESAMDDTPFPECGTAGGTLQRMVGLTMGPGWRQAIERTIGGVQGCTHLRELLFNMATAAFQTIPHAIEMRRRAAGANPLIDDAAPPFYMGHCMSWDFNGPVVARVAPKFIGWVRPERRKGKERA